MAWIANSGLPIQQLLGWFLRLSPIKRTLLIAIAVILGGVFLFIKYQRLSPAHRVEQEAASEKGGGETAGAKTIVLCHWNLENLFDDKDDRRRQPDEDYDAWFVSDPQSRKLKYQRLTEALLRLNDGIGPDILVGNEIESVRAAELLKDSLNANLPPGEKKYAAVAMIEIDAGRHIAPCVISRYPLDRVKLLGKRQRILEAHVVVNGKDLCLIGSHWTSQLSDKGSDEKRGRFAYANTIYAAYQEALRENAAVDFLVCGDFNDSPEADSVANHLHMTGSASAVTMASFPPKLFAPLSAKTPDEFGTHYYKRPLIYDHIGVSPGLLDNVGWSYIPDSVKVPTEGLIRPGSHTRKPWRFGSRNDDASGRGYSDHFPVLSKLKVAP